MLSRKLVKFCSHNSIIQGNIAQPRHDANVTSWRLTLLRSLWRYVYSQSINLLGLPFVGISQHENTHPQCPHNGNKWHSVTSWQVECVCVCVRGGGCCTLCNTCIKVPNKSLVYLNWRFILALFQQLWSTCINVATTDKIRILFYYFSVLHRGNSAKESKWAIARATIARTCARPRLEVL